MVKPAFLSVIIITRNSAPVIGGCLASLDRFLSAPHEVIVVDNHSSDSTQNIISEFSAVTLIVNEHNRGFATACHQGVRAATGEYFLFLNPDTELKNDVFREVQRLFGADSRIAVVGPKIVNSDGSLQPSVRRFPDVCSQLLILFKLNHVFPNLPPLQRYYAADFDYSQEQVVDQVMGACFFTKRAVWDLLGGFDRRFFIWFEEVDYCFNAKRKGFKTVYTPLGPVIHHLGSSFKKEFLPKKQWWFFISMLKYFLKNGL